MSFFASLCHIFGEIVYSKIKKGVFAFYIHSFPISGTESIAQVVICLSCVPSKGDRRYKVPNIHDKKHREVKLSLYVMFNRCPSQQLRSYTRHEENNNIKSKAAYTPGAKRSGASEAMLRLLLFLCRIA